MRLTFAQLEALLDELTYRLFDGKLATSEYVGEWDELMVFAGWTWKEFEAEVDKRWTPKKKATAPIFSC